MSIVKNIAKTVAITTAMIGAVEVAGRTLKKAQARAEGKNDAALNELILKSFKEIGLSEEDFERVLPNGWRSLVLKVSALPYTEMDIYGKPSSWDMTIDGINGIHPVMRYVDGVFKRPAIELDFSKEESYILYIGCEKTSKVARIELTMNKRNSFLWTFSWDKFAFINPANPYCEKAKTSDVLFAELNESLEKLKAHVSEM